MKPLYWVIIAIVIIFIVLTVSNNNKKKLADQQISVVSGTPYNQTGDSTVAQIINSLFPYYQTYSQNQQPKS